MTVIPLGSSSDGMSCFCRWRDHSIIASLELPVDSRAGETGVLANIHMRIDVRTVSVKIGERTEGILDVKVFDRLELDAQRYQLVCLG